MFKTKDFFNLTQQKYFNPKILLDILYKLLSRTKKKQRLKNQPLLM